MDKKLRKIGNILVMSMILFTIINAYFVNISLAKGQIAVEIVEAYKKASKDVNKMIENASPEQISEWYNYLFSYVNSNSGYTGSNEEIFIGRAETVKDLSEDEYKSIVEAIRDAKGGKDTEIKEKEDDMMKYELYDIQSWLANNPQKIPTLKKEFPDVVEKWQEVINNEEDEYQRVLTQNLLNGMTLGEAEENADYEVNSGKSDSAIYKYPSRDDTGKNNSEQSLEDMVSDANSFINSGELKLNQDALSNFSQTMYNILLAIGVVVAVIVGAIIGIKLMTSSIEEKAEAKKLLVPYVVGCAVVFGGFGIWKIVVTILQHI